MIFGNAAWGLRETPIEEQFKITSEMGLKCLEIGIANAPMDIQLDVADEEINKSTSTYKIIFFFITLPHFVLILFYS